MFILADTNTVRDAGKIRVGQHVQFLFGKTADGNDGIGHPEPLKGNLSGYWSRAIDEKHRLVYKIEDSMIKIIQ